MIGNFFDSTTVASAAKRGILLNTNTINTTITNNTISNLSYSFTGGNGAYGIYGGTGSSALNNVISNNTISNISSSGGGAVYGIYLTSAVNYSVTGNKIFNISNTNSSGNGAVGIFMASSSTTANVNVINNFIADVYSKGLSSGYGVGSAESGWGIFINSGAGYKIYNNTVSLSADDTNPNANRITAAINIYSSVTAAGAIDLRNNIFSNTQTFGNRYAIYSAAANTVFSNIDYNDYYTTGTALGYIGSARTTLADLQTGFGGNTNSVNISPVFVSSTDLHLKTDTNQGLDNTATSLAEVTIDIDGETRSSTPDIGADEFTFVAPTTVPICTTVSAPTSGSTNVTPNPTAITWTAVDSAAGYKIYIGTTSGGTDIVNGTMVTGTLYNATLSNNTTYYVSVVPYNAAGDATCNNEISFTTGGPAYCNAGATNNGGQKITNVTFADINNNSSNNTTYFDFTTVIGNVEQDGNYTMTITANPSASTNQAYVWIDYNQDGNFDDTTERTTLAYTYSGTASQNSYATASITIPSTAMLGNTRMRVRLNNTSIFSNTSGCGNSFYGEVEDYTINITSAGTLAVSNTKKGSIAVYPNPVKSEVFLKSAIKINSAAIFNMEGRNVLTVEKNNITGLNLSTLSKGMYILQTTDENGKTAQTKIIKE